MHSIQFGISPCIIGTTAVAFATSCPELSISTNTALERRVRITIRAGAAGAIKAFVPVDTQQGFRPARDDTFVAQSLPGALQRIPVTRWLGAALYRMIGLDYFRCSA